MNIETAAQAICGYENEMDWDIPWSIEGEEGREAYRGMATAAIDAYRTLTDAQWAAQRNEAARVIRSQINHNILDVDVHLTSLHQAAAAMTALGFRRAGEVES